MRLSHAFVRREAKSETRKRTRGILAPTAFVVVLVNATLAVDVGGGQTEDTENGDGETDMVESDPALARATLITL